MNFFTTTVKYFNEYLYCVINFVGENHEVLIPYQQRNSSLPGDEVSVALQPIKYWKIKGKDEDSFEMEYSQLFFKESKYNKMVEINYNEINSLNELIELILNRKEYNGYVLQPTCEVIYIEKYEKYNDITGYIENGIFWPDDNGIYSLHSNQEFERCHVIGDIDREKNRFIFKRVINNDNYYDGSKKSQLVKQNNFQQQIDFDKISIAQNVSQKINQLIKKQQYNDYSSLMTITIDSSNTQMWDDAIHIEMIDTNTVSLGIHCANYIIEMQPSSIELKQIGRKLFQRERQKIVSKTKVNKYVFDTNKKCKAFSIILQYNLNTHSVERVYGGTTHITIKAHFTFDSFTNSINCNTLMDERIIKTVNQDHLFANMIYLSDFVKENFHYHEHKGNGIGETIIKQYGRFFSEKIGELLHEKYGNLAIIKRDKNVFVASFRSPLRKPKDVFVIRQIYSAILNLSKEEMVYYVCGGDEKTFKELFHL
ncbi:hypothetical protein ENUP19_0121G0195 [Entamoeba nuttalli]|uniref:RNB family domain containing protein n=1 Tax=Entamoeba nuttalli TaxID=412467 RepID=A0ABQ0DIZ5_9EUKA